MSEVATPPSTIYVSELLRTWETAVLLFLNKQTPGKILTLFISPFLREIGSLPSDEPRYLQGQLNEFIRFLVFLARLVKKSKETGTIPDCFKNIPDVFTINFRHFAGKFNKEFVAGIHQQGDLISCLWSETGIISITCDTTKSKVPVGTDLQQALTDMKLKIDTPPEKFAGINGTKEENKYKPYDAPQLKFPTTTKGLDVNKYIDDFNLPDTSNPKFNKTSEPPSIANFVQWHNSLYFPSDDTATTVYFVSHSGTMKSFVNGVIKSSPLPPFVSKFNKVFERAQKTNTWSVFFKKDKESQVDQVRRAIMSKPKLQFKGFRHAESCDNRYKEKGRLKHLERVAAGEYTNLALWGILSTLTFAIGKLPELVSDDSITQPGLKICYGMNKESKEFLSDAYDGVNMVCGLKDARLAIGNFMVDFGNCGTSHFGTFTMDEDCIKLTSKENNKKVVLYLEPLEQQQKQEGAETSATYSIQARFFNNANSNTYVKDPPNPSNMPAIANFLSAQPFIDDTQADNSNGGNPIMELPPTTLLKLFTDAKTKEQTKTLLAKTVELSEAISTFIASDKFNMKLDEDKGIHRDGHRPQNWAKTFNVIHGNLIDWKSENVKPLASAQGGTNKKLRKQPNYKTMRKYIRRGRYINKTKHNRNRNHNLR